MNRLPAYIQRLPSGSINFRVAIPPELRPYFGKREIKRSLKTCNRKLAIQRARILAIRVHAAFIAIKDGDVMGNDLIEFLISRVAPDGSKISMDFDVSKPEEKEFAERMMGNLVTPTAEPDSSILLSALIESYCDEKKREDSWSEKTEAENRAIYTLLLRIIGNPRVDELSAETAREYKIALQMLPPNLNKSPKYKDMNITDMLATTHSRMMSISTINKYLNRISTLIDWAKRNNYVTENYFSGLSLKKTVKAREERDPFSDDDLKKIFSVPHFQHRRKAKHPYYHWLPYLGLYTGARLNELCQIYLNDFKQDEGIWVLNINDNYSDKRLKSPAAKRNIPIHSKLLDLGLKSYVHQLFANGQTRLFPELKNRRDGYGQDASKWFGRFKRSLDLENGDKKVFHSFRHTFSNKLKHQGIEESMVSALMGHTHNTQAFGRYGSDYETSALKAAIEKLDFDI